MPKSREKRTKNLQPASGMGVTILTSGKKMLVKLMISIVTTLLLFSRNFSRKGKTIQMFKVKINSNELFDLENY